jgi:UDP-glucose 4-epimerase
MEVAAGWRPSLQIFGNDYETDDGTGVRDYIHVSDLASGHLLALEKLDREDRSFTVNLGSETGLSVQEIVDVARSITGKSIPTEVVDRRPGDPAKLTASARKARDELGWTAMSSDVDTLVRTSWDVYQRHIQ